MTLTIEVDEATAGLLSTLVGLYGPLGVTEAYVNDEMDKGHDDDVLEVMLSLLDKAAQSI